MYEGALALKTRQKHIKVADWGTVNHYKSYPLADDEEDKKHLRRSKKEAKHDCEEFEEARKCCQSGGGGGLGGYRKRPYNPAGYYRDFQALDPVEQRTQWLHPPAINVLDTPETVEQAKGSGTLF